MQEKQLPTGEVRPFAVVEERGLVGQAGMVERWLSGNGAEEGGGLSALKECHKKLPRARAEGGRGGGRDCKASIIRQSRARVHGPLSVLPRCKP